MKLNELKEVLKNIDSINIYAKNGEQVPSHFHITEVGQVSKSFIDCGGQLRNSNKVNFQLWHSTDYDHKLSPKKLLGIINKSQTHLNLDNMDIEVEYQMEDSIGKFNLDYNEGKFILSGTKTNCLAMDKCITEPIVEDNNVNQTCGPKSGCC